MLRGQSKKIAMEANDAFIIGMAPCGPPEWLGVHGGSLPRRLKDIAGVNLCLIQENQECEAESFLRWVKGENQR